MDDSEIMADEVIFRAVAGSLKGEEFIFDEKGLLLIGRSNDCALQIPKENDMRISRRHCLVILNPPHVRVRDLNSRNGTFVNNVRLEPGAIGEKPSEKTSVDVVLKNGDSLSLGETILEFEIPSQKDATPIKTHPPQGTKIIKLARPSKTHTGTLVPKAETVDTGFFKPPDAQKPIEPEIQAPMTEVFTKPTLDLPINGDPASPSAIRNSVENNTNGSVEITKTPKDGATPTTNPPTPTTDPAIKKPIKLGAAVQDGGATIAVSPPSSPSSPSNPIKLGGPATSPPPSGSRAAKKPIQLVSSKNTAPQALKPPQSNTAPPLKKSIALAPPKAADLLAKRNNSAPPKITAPDQQSPKQETPKATPPPAIKLNKSEVVVQQNSATETPPQPEAAASKELNNAPPKKPIILNRGAQAGTKGATGNKPPMKAKIIGKKHDNPDLTEVMDVSELSDDIALSADYIRKEKKKKRVTKFKIKGPK